MTKSNGKILLVDDDEYVRLSLKLLLEQNQFDVVASGTPERIPALLDKEEVHVVLLDMNFRQGDTSSTQGLFWLKQITELRPDLPVLLMTAFGEIGLAVEAIKQGAFDFIAKPWENEKLLATVKAAVALFNEKKKVVRLSTQQKFFSSAIDKQYSDLLGESQPMADIRKKIEKIAPTDVAVLLLGENGTGKEVVARAIHRNSNRAQQVFISVDVGSLSETIFESELFGHKRGAFTDAKEDRIGKIEAASGGTLFLDEIGNLPMALQSKLLSVLQNKTITRLGTNNSIDVDVRIICATNINLKKQVEAGNFREDLYYRINTMEINIPPLRERSGDVSVLVNHFVEKFGAKYHKQDRNISADVLKELSSYRWPGNVRELQHAVERAIILSETTELTTEDFGINRSSDDVTINNYNLESLEAWAIRKAVAKHNGNISHAAAELGLSRGAMYRRMEKYGI